MRRLFPRLSLLLILGGSLLPGCRCESGNGEFLSAEEQAGKKIVTLNRNEAFRSLDPVKQFDQSSSELISNLYDTLVEYHYLKRPYELVPALLREMPERQGDSLTYTFRLREGVTFHDADCFPDGKGRELNADDAIYSFKRFADANLNVNSYVLMQGFIVGMDEFRERSQQQGADFSYETNEIEGIRKVDDYTFTVTLTQENPLAFYPLAMSSMSIVPREAVEHYGAEFERRPVGTGPFQLKQMARRGVIIFERNDRYWGSYPTEGAPGDEESGILRQAGQPIPFIDEVHLPLIEEAQPRILSFQRGELDLVDVDRDNFSNFMEFIDGEIRLLPQWADRIDMYAVPGTSNEYYRFNMRDPLVGGYSAEKKALRQAIAYALDIPGYIDLIMNGRALELSTVVPHPIAGSQDYIEAQGFEHSIERAREKLAEAGYPNGEGLPVIEIEYRASTTQTRHAWEFHRERLAAAGIRAKANFQTFSAWLQKTDQGNFQIAAGGWMADYPDAENFYQLLYGPNTAPGPNNGNYQNDRYDELYEKIRFMANGPERFALFKELNEILREDVPLIPFFNQMRVGMTQEWLLNFRRNLMYFPPLKYVDVDLDRKAQGL